MPSPSGSAGRVHADAIEVFHFPIVVNSVAIGICCHLNGGSDEWLAIGQAVIRRDKNR